MKISNNLYDFLNDVVKIGIPSLGAFYAAVAALLGWQHVEAVVGIVAALTTLLGIWLKILKSRYQPIVDGEISVDATLPETTEVRLILTNSDILEKHEGDIVTLTITENKI